MDARSGIRTLSLGAAAGLLLTSVAVAAPETTTDARLTQDGASGPGDDLLHHDPAALGMVVTKAAALRGKVRTVREVKWQRATTGYGPGDTWSTFVRGSGGQWESVWDRATNAPLRIWGDGLPAPGAMASPQIAEAVARQLLAQHISLLAPGSAPSDFRLVSNHSDGDQRSIGFVQTYQGLDVVGGQVSFRFKNDRLFVIASEAIPQINVPVPQLRARLSTLRLRQQVGAQLAGLGLPAAAQVTAFAEAQPVILPLIGEDSVLGVRVVVPHEVVSPGEGRWTLYADPTTGAAVAFTSQSFYATGRVLFNVPSRYPGKPRVDLPASRMKVSINNSELTTALDGSVTWTPDQPQNVVTSLTGDLVNVVNKAGTSSATATLSISPGGTAIWNASATATDDAQVTVAVHTNTVKEYVRTFAPTMRTLDQAITTNVNVAQVCNANFDGKDLNFYRSSTQCENTGRIADVVYHEFGHAMHFNSLIPGVGFMDGAFSEGLSDFLAVSITDDPGMGRGFFFNDTALRHMDPPDKEPRWPEDTGEIHKTGIIFGAAMWDLRKDFIARMGRATAVPLINKLYFAAVQRASDIPSTLVEVLAADDDDGNLANGTPNECSILAEFGKHGLRSAGGIASSPGALVAGADRKTKVSITLIGRSPRCASEAVSSVEVSWRPGPKSAPPAGKIAATPGPKPEEWVAEIPLPTSDSMTYSATVTFASSVKISLPDNYADTAYQLYEGTTVPLLCANMDTNPLTSGWTGSTGWAWGAPVSTGKFDPRAAFTGSNVLSTILSGDYTPDSTYTLTLPTVDVGNYSDVRLQYRRWLTVEDSQFDKATISANGKVLWTNPTEAQGDSSALHNMDREWRFHDVPLSSKFRGKELTVAFGLTSDAGLELGGWALDDLCIVADPNSVCGDGQLSSAEECDDGTSNSNKPNACRLDCKRATCGDSVVDKGEECDDGGESDACSATCFSTDGAGCCDAGNGPGGPVLLSLAVVGLLVVRRRRTARPA